MSEPRTPRDWLLAKHTRADAKLDELRRDAVARIAASALPASDEVSLTWREFLVELFRPNRTAWRALTAVWIALAVFQVARLAVRAPSTQPPPSAEAFTAWIGHLKSHEAFAQINRRP